MDKSVFVSLLENVRQNSELVKSIRASTLIYLLAEKNGGVQGFVDCKMIDALKPHYLGLDFNVLVALWYDHYLSIKIKENATGGIPVVGAGDLVEYYVTNKMIAAGMLLDEGW